MSSKLFSATPPRHASRSWWSPPSRSPHWTVRRSTAIRAGSFTSSKKRSSTMSASSPRSGARCCHSDRERPMARVLVIEDNPANLRLAALLLRNVGHIVSSAVDAESGLTMARNDRPDLILMDLQLPGMDGMAATALLKQDPATAAIPVIALTAMAMKADREKTRRAGCDAYIAKPLRYRDLYAAIDALLLKARTESR